MTASAASGTASGAASSPTFTHRIRVYFEDTDTGGIVFYVNYLKFFERARTEWLRAGGNGLPGVSQQEIGDRLGLMFVVRSTTVDYRRPARLDDELRIESAVDRCGRVGIDFVQRAFVRDALVAAGRVQVACVTRDGMRPHVLPDAIRDIFVAR